MTSPISGCSDKTNELFTKSREVISMEGIWRQLTIPLEAEEYEKLKDLAARLGKDTSELTRSILLDFMKSHPSESAAVTTPQ